MKTYIIISVFLSVFSINFSYSQLTYKSGGKVLNSENRKLTPMEVKELLADKPELLDLYKKGRAKKTVGNVLMVGGVLLMAGDVLKGLTADAKYPGALTYIGSACILISIPVRIGSPGKIRKTVDGYNSQLSEDDERIIKNTAFILNGNGIGLKVTF